MNGTMVQIENECAKLGLIGIICSAKEDRGLHSIDITISETKYSDDTTELIIRAELYNHLPPGICIRLIYLNNIENQIREFRFVRIKDEVKYKKLFWIFYIKENKS